jgi:bifunctional N-acetylglucosamine-1-phosphate-uridyltransferase/glucosamine-1-phosphate-acetyltransferase GlmU-like protein
MIVVIMAGGHGKRMESNLPKVLHNVYSIFNSDLPVRIDMMEYKHFLKPMIVHVIETALKLNPTKILIVVGQYKNIIESTINKFISNSGQIEYIIQEEALGTGHAIKCCLDKLSNYPNEQTLILSGDVPLISTNTLDNLLSDSNINININKILVTKLENPFGCGRIILNSQNHIIKIVEEKDCSDIQKLIDLVNCGIYQINSSVLCDLIPEINNNNKANEYYLTDIIELMIQNNIPIEYYELQKIYNYEIKNVNTQKDLNELNNFLLDLK